MMRFALRARSFATLAFAGSIAAAAALPAGGAPVTLPAEQEVILITGSTSGLGQELARRLAADRAHVIVQKRSREGV